MRHACTRTTSSSSPQHYYLLKHIVLYFRHVFTYRAIEMRPETFCGARTHAYPNPDHLRNSTGRAILSKWLLPTNLPPYPANKYKPPTFAFWCVINTELQGKMRPETVCRVILHAFRTKIAREIQMGAPFYPRRSHEPYPVLR